MNRPRIRARWLCLGLVVLLHGDVGAPAADPAWPFVAWKPIAG